MERNSGFDMDHLIAVAKMAVGIATGMVGQYLWGVWGTWHRVLFNRLASLRRNR